MPEIKKETLKGYGPPIVTKTGKSYANDPYFHEKAEKAKASLSKLALTVLKEN